ncbi:MAG: GNAT family N-acetyltransferase [Saprospiraceae bacterium]
MTPTKLDFQIEDFLPEHKQRWKEINEAWVTEDFYMEEIDHQHCSHPETSILAGGGHILVATVDGLVVGTAGIFKENDDVYELIKMAVDKNYRGLGIGKALCVAAIERVQEIEAKMFYLLSNTKAAAAIELYRQLGFVEVPLDNAEWKRANIKMEMKLNN